MHKATLIRSVVDDSPFGALIHDGVNFKAVSLSPESNDWSIWANTSCSNVSQVKQAIGLDLYATESRHLTDDEILRLKDLGNEELSLEIASAHRPSLRYEHSDDSRRRRYVAESFKSDRYPISVSSMPLTAFNRASRQAVIHYKVMSARSDNLEAQIGYSVKRVRAIFDPNLGPEGGYRCPVGTEFGGYITDRFGRGCGAGITRRIGRALGEAGRSLERFGENRQLDRLQRAQNRTQRQNLRAQRSSARAERAAVGLERGAERLVGSYKPAGRGRPGRRGIPGGASSGPRRIVAGQPAATRRRVIVPPAGRTVRTQGPRPVSRPGLNAGRRGGRLVDAWTPGEYRRGDSRRIKNRANRYAGQPDNVVRRALTHFSPRPIRNEADKASEARRRQQRLEVLQEMVNRGMDIPEEFKREIRVYKIKPQRKRRSGERRERIALALERGAERVLQGRNRRQRRLERQNGLNRRERMSLALERGAERVLTGRRSPNLPPQGRPPASSPRVVKRTVTRTPATPGNIRRPQPKRVSGSRIKYSELTPAQKRRVTQRANAELLDLDARWRRRLNLGPDEKLTKEAIDKHLAERRPLVSERAHGSLRADAHDWDVLSEWKSSKKSDLLDDVGPRRRNKIASESGIAGVSSKRKAPAKKAPAKKAPAKKAPSKVAPKPKVAPQKGRTTGTGAKTKPNPKPKAPVKSPAKPKSVRKPAAPKASAPRAEKPATPTRPNIRGLRAMDEYKKAKSNDAILSRMILDMAQRHANAGNRQALDRQIRTIDRSTKKYSMMLENVNTSKAQRAQALAFLEGLRERRRQVTKLRSGMKVAPNKNG